MAWNFRGSLSSVDLQRDMSVVLPFEGCAWLTEGLGTGAPEPVLDARLELVPLDDIRIQAIREDAAGAAIKCGAPIPNATGCIYRLGSTVYLLVGVQADTLATIKRNLLAALADRHLHLHAAIDFAGFAAEDPIARLASAQPAGVARSDFEDGFSPIYVEACRLSFAANHWTALPAAPDPQPLQPLTAGDYRPRL